MYQETFNSFMRLMRPFMKQQGFISRGNNFYKRHPEGNIGIINFQKSSELGKFTVNLGVYSILLAEFYLSEFGEKKVKDKPSIIDSHWHIRLGFLMPKKNSYETEDKWWKYDESTNINQLCDEISTSILIYGIPMIEKNITDEQIEMDLLSYKSKDSWESLRWPSFKNLSALYKMQGKDKQLEPMIRYLERWIKKDPNDFAVKKHLDKLIENKLDKKFVPKRKEHEEKCNNPPKKMKP